MNRLSKIGINVGALALIIASSAQQWIKNPTALHYAAAVVVILNAVLHGMPDQEKPSTQISP